jgi:predicted PurR-regulated permease PerM
MNPKPWSPTARYLVFGLSAVLLIGLLWLLHPVIRPLVIAAFIAYMLNPVVNGLTRITRLSRRAVVNLVFAACLVLLVAISATTTTLLLDQFQDTLGDTIDLFNQVISWLVQPHVVLGLLINLSPLASQLTQFRSNFLSQISVNSLKFLERTSLGALWILVVIVGVYFLMANWPDLRRGFIASFPEAYHADLEELYRRLRTIWINYLRGQLLLMLIVGIVFTLAWLAIGIPGALVLGILAGFFTLVPDVGPFIAAAMAVAVALLEGSTLWTALPHFAVALIVAAVYLVLIGVKNFWLRPHIIGRSVNMPVALVFILIVMATILWGILGALLVVPTTASLAIILDYLRRRLLGMDPFPAQPDRGGSS